MAITTWQKLKIKEGATLLALNAPVGFRKNLGSLPPKVNIVFSGNDYQQIHWFVLDKAQMEKEMKKVMSMMNTDTILWIYFPKGSSKLQTDLTRDNGWDSLMALGNKLTWISLVSFDDTWSVFGCRYKTQEDKKKDARPQVEREVFQYVNPATKDVRLPDDLAEALRKNKQQAAFFDTLSFTNKKEYIEWVVTAKREETRRERLKGTIERLAKEWKNPANR